MAKIQSYIGWPTNVNRTILDSTNLTIGENALDSDAMGNGLKRSVQKNGFVPEKYEVTMTFNWTKPVADTGKNEFQLFEEWFKYRHKYGSVPFEFPSIIYSPNPGTGYYDTDVGENVVVEYYKITSGLKCTKSGEEVSVTMTWESVYTGVISIDTPTPACEGIEAHTSFVDVYFTEVSDTAPVHDQFTVSDNGTDLTQVGFCYDGLMTVRIYYSYRTHGSISVHIENYSGLTTDVGPSTF